VLTCTVATADHLPFVRVLARSLAEHVADVRLLALIPDDPAPSAQADEPFEALHPSDIGIDDPELGRRALLYTANELACSLKAPLLRHAVDLTDGPVAYLDADCLVCSDLAPLLDAAADSGLALTAHSLEPAPLTREPVEALFQQHGVFNAGVLAASRRGSAALDWWAERTARHCVYDVARGISADQSWLGLVPALFDFTVVRDGGINVMGWNLFDRDIGWDRDTPTVGGEPLRCFHFAGTFDPHRPEAFGPAPGQRAPWPSAAERPGLTRLCREYATRLLEAGYDAALDARYGFAELQDGTSVGPVMRETYRESLLDAEHGAGAEPPNPFVDSTSDAFLSWLASPGHSGVPRYVERVRARRHDLREAFPAVPGGDDRPLLRWAREAAARGEIDLAWLR
jgi:hypothetical protein